VIVRGGSCWGTALSLSRRAVVPAFDRIDTLAQAVHPLTGMLRYNPPYRSAR
jgi:hypothetical protein